MVAQPSHWNMGMLDLEAKSVVSLINKNSQEVRLEAILIVPPDRSSFVNRANSADAFWRFLLRSQRRVGVSLWDFECMQKSMHSWSYMSNVAIKLEEDFHIDFTNSRFDHHLEPQTTIYKWMFQLDDSKSLHKKWLFHQTTIYKCLFGVPGSFQFPLHLLIWWNLPNSSLMAEVVSSQGNSISDSERPIPKTSSYIQAVVSTIF